MCVLLRTISTIYILYSNFNPYAQITGQSRVTLVTHDKGCVRYPTEGNSSNHELTTAMHHLSNCLARAIVSLGFQLGFKSW